MAEENGVMDAKKAATERNVANNTNNVRAAADIAANTNNPYAKAAGMAVKAADKMSGGKASEKLGKATDKFMKSQGLKGKMMQAALNKMSESGTSDRLASAMSKKNGAATSGVGAPKSAQAPDAGTENKIKDKAEQTSANEGSGSVEGSTSKVVKYGLIGCALLFPLVIFAVLFTGASQVFVNSISLGTADSLSGEEVDKKIKKKGDKGIEEEKTDDDVAYDIYINDESILTFKKSNIVQIASEKKYLRRKYNEATLDKIEDFYPAVKDESKNYDENMVYDFFYKMYNLYVSYRDNYEVYLDLPLLMATLNLQSPDKNIIFSSNLSPEDRQKKARELPIEEFDYYYDWINSGYKISRDNSQHDMELLASRMVSRQEKETCTDSSGKQTQEKILRDNEIGTQTLTCAEGETYKVEYLGYVIDTEKYKEFLKQFLEKKYYLDGEHDIEGEVLIEGEIEENQDNNVQKPAVGDFRSWTQCKQSWSSMIVPTSSKTMCQIGCLITSITMQIARSGTIVVTESLDPGIAAKKFSFANGGNLYWNSVSNLAPNFIYKSKINLVGMNKKSIASKLLSYDPSKYYIILGVGKYERNKLHHYVALDYVDASNNEIYIMDPASTKYTKLYDVYKVYSAHIYEKKD